MKKFLQNNFYCKIFFVFLFSLFASLIFTTSRVSASPTDPSDWGSVLQGADETFEDWKDAFNYADQTGKLMSWNIIDSSGNVMAPDPNNLPMIGIASDKGETWFTLGAYTDGGAAGWNYYFINNDYPHWYIEYSDTLLNACTPYHTDGDTVPYLFARPLVEGAVSWCNFSDTGFADWVNAVDGDKDILEGTLGLKKTSATESLMEDVVMANLKKLLQAFANLLVGINNFILGLIERILIVDVNNTGVTSAWAAVRNVADVLLIVALLFIAFFNVIRFQIDYYTAKALIPRLAIAAIMINFSFILSKGIIDFGNVLTNYFITLTKFNSILDMNLITQFSSGAITIAVGAAAAYAALTGTGFALVLGIIAAIAIGILLAILFFRIALLYILTAFSPLVFLFSILPFTRDLTKQWWNYMVRYAFMGAVIALILYVASSI